MRIPGIRRRPFVWRGGVRHRARDARRFFRKLERRTHSGRIFASFTTLLHRAVGRFEWSDEFTKKPVLPKSYQPDTTGVRILARSMGIEAAGARSPCLRKLTLRSSIGVGYPLKTIALEKAAEARWVRF